MVTGEQVFNVGESQYRMRSNDVFVTPPSLQHGSGSNLMERAFFYWLQIKLPPKNSSILCLTPQQSFIIAKRLAAVKKLRFAGDKRMGIIFEELFKLYHSKGDPLKKITISSRIIELLLLVISCENNQGDVSVSPDIGDVIDYIDSRPDIFFSAQELAQVASLSVSRFKVKFKKEIGIPPSQYVLRKKIDLAKAMLDSGKSVTEVAFDLGFSSSQYFATVFKRFTLRTPREYCRL